MTATPLTLQLLKAAAEQHPLLLQLIANPPTYEEHLDPHHTIRYGQHTQETAWASHPTNNTR